MPMRAFLDFEASSLNKQSYPIEVAWVFEDGQAESYLIRPAPDWTDWDPEAQAIHNITQHTLTTQGTPHDQVAARMIETLTGHDLIASAPSWDGKWLSRLLRAANYPRHSLRLRDSDEALIQTTQEILKPKIPPDQLERLTALILATNQIRQANTKAQHRALPDAQEERTRWLKIKAAATQFAQGWPDAR